MQTAPQKSHPDGDYLAISMRLVEILANSMFLQLGQALNGFVSKSNLIGIAKRNMPAWNRIAESTPVAPGRRSCAFYYTNPLELSWIKTFLAVSHGRSPIC